MERESGSALQESYRARNEREREVSEGYFANLFQTERRACN